MLMCLIDFYFLGAENGMFVWLSLKGSLSFKINILRIFRVL